MGVAPEFGARGELGGARSTTTKLHMAQETCADDAQERQPLPLGFLPSFLLASMCASSASSMYCDKLRRSSLAKRSRACLISVLMRNEIGSVRLMNTL